MRADKKVQAVLLRVRFHIPMPAIGKKQQHSVKMTLLVLEAKLEELHLSPQAHITCSCRGWLQAASKTNKTKVE